VLAGSRQSRALDAGRVTGTVQLTLICDRRQTPGPSPAGQVHAVHRRYTPAQSEVSEGRLAEGLRPGRGRAWTRRAMACSVAAGGVSSQVPGRRLFRFGEPAVHADSDEPRRRPLDVPGSMTT
jgi:hypothetical protein